MPDDVMEAIAEHGVVGAFSPLPDTEDSEARNDALLDALRVLQEAKATL